MVECPCDTCNSIDVPQEVYCNNCDETVGDCRCEKCSFCEEVIETGDCQCERCERCQELIEYCDSCARCDYCFQLIDDCECETCNYCDLNAENDCDCEFCDECGENVSSRNCVCEEDDEDE